MDITGGVGPARTPTPPPLWSQKRSRYLATKNMTHNRPVLGTFDTHSAPCMEHFACHSGSYNVIHCHHSQ